MTLNEISGANPGGRRRLLFLGSWAVRIAQFPDYA